MTSKLNVELTVEKDGKFSQDMHLDLTEASDEEKTISAILWGMLYIFASESLDDYGEGVYKLIARAATVGIDYLNKQDSNDGIILNDSKVSMYTM